VSALAAAGVSVRPGEVEDEQGLLTLCTSALLPEDSSDIEGLRRYIRGAGPGCHGVAFVGEASGSIVGAATGCWRTRGGGTSGHLGLLAVEEAYRARGLGGELLSRLERAFAAAGAETVQAGGTQPYFWWPGVDQRYEGAVALFRARGYVAFDEVVNMDVDLRRPDLSLTALDVDVHRLTATEYPSFLTWMRSAWDDDWADEVSLVVSRDPVSCWVAMGGSAFLGFAAYDTNRRGWFGPMGSTGAARGRGIGRTLLRRCMQDLMDRGEQSCEICWIGPEAFYREAVGATVGRRFLQLKKALNASSD
jgi:mycothiol synthase